MKWWGWGDPGKVFPAERTPALWPWAKHRLGIDQEELIPPVARESIRLRRPRICAGLLEKLGAVLAADQISSDDEERLLHSYGKSYPDLLRVRRGEIPFPPDLVVFPKSHGEVEAIVRAVASLEVELIPFGGGTNIVGGINPGASERTIVTLSLRRMGRLLSLDAESGLATIEAGATGPEIEESLAERGFSLGHYPDSFEYSTLGGWIATRSAGMQSDAYGRIEDLLVSVKLVTAAGTIATRTVPASSAGPDLNRLVLGSEGTFGVITEATVRVHPVPPARDVRGYLLRSFEDGVAALHEIRRSSAVPNLMRLQDANETELIFVMKTPGGGLKALLHRLFGRCLRARGYKRPSLLIVGFEGTPADVQNRRKAVRPILRRHGALPLGQRAGESWSKEKYDIPYLRDFMMDYGCMVDVAETSCTWGRVLPLYYRAVAAGELQFKSNGLKGYVSCHISHTYPTGACLYFTYASRQIPGHEIDHYYGYKRLFTRLFLHNGAALTHHHAVGLEHLPWMEEEIAPAGLDALRAVKASLDPEGIFNPGKCLPPEPVRESDARERSREWRTPSSVPSPSPQPTR
jgi:alkyldihydroxyacetonephosphate synthase